MFKGYLDQVSSSAARNSVWEGEIDNMQSYHLPHLVCKAHNHPRLPQSESLDILFHFVHLIFAHIQCGGRERRNGKTCSDDFVNCT